MNLNSGIVYDTEDGPACLPLRSVEVRACTMLRDGCVRLSQAFTSGGEAIATAAYCFPLHAGAQVFSVQAVIMARGTTRTLRAGVRDKQEARAAFGRATQEGRSAVLLESSEEAADVFKLELGSIPAGAIIAITTSFLTPLSSTVNEANPTAHSLRLVLPMALLHRYSPKGAPGGAHAEEPGAWTVEEALALGSRAASHPHGLTFALQAKASRPIAALLCPSHPTQAVVPPIGQGSTTASLSLTLDPAAWCSRQSDIQVILTTETPPGEGGMEEDNVVACFEPTPASAAAAAAAGIATGAPGGAPGGGAGGGAGGEAAATSPPPSLSEATLDSEKVTMRLSIPRKVGLSLLEGGVSSIAASEVIFLLDKSGSMDGQRIESAKGALNLALRSLPQGMLFNVRLAPPPPPCLHTVFFSSYVDSPHPPAPSLFLTRSSFLTAVSSLFSPPCSPSMMTPRQGQRKLSTRCRLGVAPRSRLPSLRPPLASAPLRIPALKPPERSFSLRMAV